MGEEEQLQREWRSLVVNKLDSLDEELKSMQGELKAVLALVVDVKESKIRLAELEKNVIQCEKKIIENIERKYVTKEAFTPIKYVVYGMVSIILTSVLGAIVTLVIANAN